MNLKKFEHKNILITGASSGIGEAIAYQLAEIETNLFLTGRNTERLAAVSAQCHRIHTPVGSISSSDPASPSKIINSSISGELNSSLPKKGSTDLPFSINVFNVDFSDTASIDDFVSDITKQDISFDYIILNAGVSQRALTLETDFSVDRKIMETNYFGPIYLIKKLSGMFQSRKTVHIAITSSISGLFGFPLRSAYCASKHALFGFFESLELENEHIKVTFLIPGRINTPISKSAVLGDGSVYSKMDSGQAGGMDVGKCARVALHAISKEKHRKLIGGKELLMVYIKKFIPPLFYKLARKVSKT